MQVQEVFMSSQTSRHDEDIDAELAALENECAEANEVVHPS